ncbi:DinB family protein [Streptomyces sp. UNOC14_S4]|uniref:DinB family protein n=1 Tax=Streptomyces sp. UNOC14_S4 TaxID=2872340 RepID=UPI001E60810C|nr:DinB family protein [Streptomyces sp. UNOC14_S4]MCC3767973.1 DinB family protein [Streptomyces sp. UNOC14_S4]
MPTTPDGRPMPSPRADERTLLEGWLDFHRATLALKCSDLDDRQARTASAEPSRITLLGLVRHMEIVERHWFQDVFARREGTLRQGPETDLGFALDPDQGLDEALASWRAEVERSQEAIADRSLDDCGHLAGQNAAFLESEEVSLRWILTHMIEEYARHNGHADLIRERVDGTTGL